MAKINLILNMATSLAALWIFQIYGSLAHWWGHVYRSSGGQVIAKSDFFAHADRLRIAAATVLLLNTLSAWALLKQKQAPKIGSAIAIGIAVIGLALCLLISF